MATITVIKRDHDSQETIRWTGDVLARGETWVNLLGRFGLEQADVGGVLVIYKNDFMREWFYSDRYYNIYQVEDQTDGHIKGWYCNITRPAEITRDFIALDDLALDLVVSLSGEIILLDEDEYADLNLSTAEQQAVQNALATLRRMVAQRQPPFDKIPTE